MWRMLKLLLLPFAAAVAVAVVVAWIAEPRPRAVAHFQHGRFPIGFSQDGSICCLCCPDWSRDQRSYTFCDTRTGLAIAEYQAPIGYQGYRMTCEGTLLTYSSARTTSSEVVVNSFDPRTRLATTPLKQTVGKCRDIRISGDGATVAAVIGDNPQAAIWDLASGERRLVIDLELRHKPLLSLSHDGRLLAVHELFKDDMTDKDQPFRIFLFDTRSGRLSDRLELPESTLGAAYFLPDTDLLALTEMKFRVNPSTLGSNGPAIREMASKEKYLDLSRTTKLNDARVAVSVDPSGEFWLVDSGSPGYFQVVDLAGKPLSPLLPLMRQEVMSRPRLVPGTTFMISHVQEAPDYPQWARDLAAQAGLTWFSGALRSEVWVVNWRTGARRNLHTTRWAISPSGALRPAVALTPNAAISPDGRVLGLAYQTEDDFRTEFWDFPLAERPWWLIITAAVGAAILAVLLVLRWPSRRKICCPAEAAAVE